MESWESIEAVTRMQSYIEQHLGEIITLYHLANAAGYSPWHSERIFKKLTGKTPFEYIRALRLSNAAVELRDGERKIIDVALDYVFDSHEGFTRAFSRQFGISPKQYSKNPPPIKLFMPNSVRDYYRIRYKGEVNMNETVKPRTVFVQVIERPKRKLILKRGRRAAHYFEYCDEVGCEVWGILSSIKEAIYEPMGLWLPKSMVFPDTSVYAQGVEVPIEYDNEVPEGFDIISLEPCRWMVFQGEPFDDDAFEDAISELWEVMKGYNPEIYGFAWADNIAPRIQLEPKGYRGYIEARPVRPINE